MTILFPGPSPTPLEKPPTPGKARHVAGLALYQEPVVLDGGEAAEVTLGKNGFDVVDGTQYRQKTPGVAAI